VDYFGASFDRLLHGIFHADPTTPLAQLRVAAAVAWHGCYNLDILVAYAAD